MGKLKNRSRKKGPIIRGKSARKVEFELNPFYERLLEMKEKKPAAFNSLSVPTRLTVEAYTKARAGLQRNPVDNPVDVAA